MGNMRAILIGQYIKGLNNSLSNPKKFVTGSATHDAKKNHSLQKLKKSLVIGCLILFSNVFLVFP